MESHSERDTVVGVDDINHRGKQICVIPDGADSVEPPKYVKLFDNSEPRCSNNSPSVDAIDMVEELIYKNYRNLNLSLDGNSLGSNVEAGGGERGGGHIAAVSRKESGESVRRGKQPFTSAGGGEDMRNISRVGNLVQGEAKNKAKVSIDVSKNVTRTYDNVISNDSISSSGGLRTKVLASGFSSFLVKSSLKGKGAVCTYPEGVDGFGVSKTSQNKKKSWGVDSVVLDASSDVSVKAENPSRQSVSGVERKRLDDGINSREWMKPAFRRGVEDVVLDAPLDASGQFENPSRQSGSGVQRKRLGDGITSREWMKPGFCRGVDDVVLDAPLDASVKAENPSRQSVSRVQRKRLDDGITLREWMKPGLRKLDKAERLDIFMQIVQLVDLAHSKQIVLRDLRPSCLKLLPSNRVKYVGTLARNALSESMPDLDVPFSKRQLSADKDVGSSEHALHTVTTKHRKLNENIASTRQQFGFLPKPDYKHNTVDISSTQTHYSGYSEDRPRKRSSNGIIPNSNWPQLVSVNSQSEERWYTSPEELQGMRTTLFSNIYSLGILLFELLSHSESSELHTEAMLKIQHRILPPDFLSENPKEAGFCLWLLHPEPSSRPTTRAILQSELMGESQELTSEDGYRSVQEDFAESELLLQFLTSLKEQKDQKASKLVEDISSLETDIKEIEKRRSIETRSIRSLEHKNTREQDLLPKEPLRLDTCDKVSPSLNVNDDRLMRNMSQLENAYFSMRSQLLLPDASATGRLDTDFLNRRDKWSHVQNGNTPRVVNQKPADRVGAFFDGLCKYTRYKKFEVRGTLRNGDLLSSANVICSLSFDRDEEYFAAAGVSKKIKIFDFNGLLDDSVDIQYPVAEMSSKCKLSCVCWNSYIKNYLASTDYDGAVQLWDASTGQGFARYKEHETRIWSVDFSQMDPMKLASGSDDCCVKLWSLNERKSTCTIRSAANVCCVQFSPYTPHLMAFGSADHKMHCYDLRNTRIPWCSLAGHGKAVSYVKFLDHETLVSASTDNTLKLWDLNQTVFGSLSTNACGLTFKGHTNEKNFVGLAVSDGYIACGSETNEIYSYYRSLPMPITSHQFGSIDPISGQESRDDNGQFVSSVCWRRKSNMFMAANSTGTIKVLQMV
ncbi:hypothetical protein C5167_047698 [Papaver somniferum]|uniref:Protein kinase domain-containing protein n=1 Tax=Papaver somniferum TaxID=3469 RepID=A0A4Y7LHE4_PAPSO|nr:protein SUPPRESSOR OF PHYA-105 1-like isoform X2 [Papaver somniferum]RZC84914.1 hypothetical protein C5167_047698 [Papaver somniferum]